MKHGLSEQQGLHNGEEHMVPPETALLASPHMSRRAFFSSAAVVGALTLLGSVISPKGTVVSAYADEAGNLSFEVYVLSNREVPFYAFDTLNDKPVSGMRITITASIGDLERTFINNTDANGLFIWSMDDMLTGYPGFFSELRDLAVKKASSMDAELWAQKDGYRDIHIPKISLAPGSASNSEGRRSSLVSLPTTPVKKMDDGTDELYLSTLTLDGEDINYTKQDVFVHPNHDTLHTIQVEVAAQEAGQTVAVGILILEADGKAVKNNLMATEKAGTTAPYRATFAFTDYFLRDIPVGGTLALLFSANEKYVFHYIPPLQFKLDTRPSLDGFLCFNASVGEQKNEGTKDNRSKIDLDKFSWSIPSHDDLFIGLPGMPIEFFFDNSGRFGVTATLLSTSLIKVKDGKYVGKTGDTKTFAGMTGQAAFDKQYDEAKQAIQQFNETRQRAKGNKSKCGLGKMTTSLDISFELKLIGLGTIESVENDTGGKDLVWTADMGFQVSLGVDASLTQPFTIGPVPLYICFTFSASLTVQILVGMQFKNMFEDIDWHHHLPNGNGGPGIMVITKVDIGAEIAIGVKGVAAIGIFGHGYLRTVQTYNYLPGYPYPRLQAYLGAGFGVFVQILFVKKRFTIKDTKDQCIGDTWKNKSSSAKQASLEGAANPSSIASLEEYRTAENVPVTQDDLAACAEYVIPASQSQGNAAATESEELALDGATNYAIANEGAAVPSVGEVADADETSSPYIPITAIPSDCLAGTAQLEGSVETGVCNPYEQGHEYNVLDGLKPTRQEVIRSDVYSNMRIATVESHVPFNAWDESRSLTLPLMTGRIGTVLIGSSALTRLFLSIWDSTSEQFNPEIVIDFDLHGIETQLPPEERLDVDFSIDTFVDNPRYDKTYGGVQIRYALISVVSIPLSKQSASLEEQMASQFITTILFNVSEFLQDVKPDNYRYISPECSVIKPEGYAVFNPHVLIHAHPELHEGSSKGQRPYLASLSVVYSKTNVETGEGSLGITTYEYDLVQEGEPQLTRRVNDQTLDIKSPVSSGDLAEGAIDVNAGPSCFPVQIDGTYWSNVIISWCGKDSAREEAGFENTSTSFVSSILLTYENDQFVQRHAGLLTLPGVSSLTVRERSQADYPFVYTDETVEGASKPIMLVSIDPQTRVPQAMSGVGYTSTVNYFSSEDGDRLYAVRVIDGNSDAIDEDARVMSKGLDEEEREYIDNGALLYSNVYSDSEGYDTNGYQKSTESVYIKRYQIFETRYVKSLHAYYNFYPIAQLDFCPHTITSAPLTVNEIANPQADRSFLISSISDFDSSKAELRRVYIPRRLSLHVSAAAGETRLAAVGDLVVYELTVTNVGTEPITGFTTEVYARKNDGDPWKLVTTERFDHLKQHLTESPDSLRLVYDEDGHTIPTDGGCYETKTQHDLFDVVGVLWPGCTRTYRLHFTMTEGLHGWTKFSVKAVKGTSNFDDLSVGETEAQLSGDGDTELVLAALEEGVADTEAQAAQYLEALAAFSEEDFVGKIEGDSDLYADFDETPIVEINDTQTLGNGRENVPPSEIESYENFGDGVYYTTKEEAEEEEKKRRQAEDDKADEQLLTKTGDGTGGLIASAAGLAAAAAIGIGIAMKTK